MKNFLACLFAICFSIQADAQKMMYADWQEEASRNSSLLPKYGGAEKTAEQLAADSVLIEKALTESGNARKASNYFVGLGFDNLAKGDQKTAMLRFNQAWLLDPKNENVYWGFGGIYFSFNDHGKALAQYTEGLVLNPQSANIMVDMATIGMARYNSNKDLNELTSSISLLNYAYEIAPTNQTLVFKLTICYFLKGDCTNALKFYNECLTLGGGMITESFKKAIIEKCKNN